MSNILSPLNENTVLYLPFNEGSGTTAYDYSSEGNNGTITGATYVKIQDGGYALDFDGTDDKVTLSSSVEFNSFLCWFKPSAEITTTNFTGLLYDSSGGTSGSYNGIRFGGFTGNVTNEIISIIDDGNSNIYYWDSSIISSITTDEHCMAIIWEVSSSNYRLFYDGEDKGLATIYGSPSKMGNKTWDIGRFASNFFNGNIRLPIMFSEELSFNEYKKFYQETYIQ